MTFAEPALNELLADPMIRLVMRSDHVTDADLRTLACRQRARTAAASPLAPTRPLAYTGESRSFAPAPPC